MIRRGLEFLWEISRGQTAVPTPLRGTNKKAPSTFSIRRVVRSTFLILLFNGAFILRFIFLAGITLFGWFIAIRAILGNCPQ